MSTSLLYHAFGIRGYMYVNTIGASLAHSAYHRVQAAAVLRSRKFELVGRSAILTLQRKLVVGTKFFEPSLSVALVGSMVSDLNSKNLVEHGFQTVFFHWQQ